jgi:hypothetical protein
METMIHDINYLFSVRVSIIPLWKFVRSICGDNFDRYFVIV